MSSLATLFWTRFKNKIEYVPKLIFYKMLMYASVKAQITKTLTK